MLSSKADAANGREILSMYLLHWHDHIRKDLNVLVNQPVSVFYYFGLVVQGARPEKYCAQEDSNTGKVSCSPECAEYSRTSLLCFWKSTKASISNFCDVYDPCDPFMARYVTPLFLAWVTVILKLFSQVAPPNPIWIN